VVKLVYSEEWRRSLVDSHRPSGATDAVLRTHSEGLDTARRALAAYAPDIERLAAACAGGGAAAATAAVKWF